MHLDDEYLLFVDHDVQVLLFHIRNKHLWIAAMSNGHFFYTA